MIKWRGATGRARRWKKRRDNTIKMRGGGWMKDCNYPDREKEISRPVQRTEEAGRVLYAGNGGSCSIIVIREGDENTGEWMEMIE